MRMILLWLPRLTPSRKLRQRWRFASDISLLQNKEKNKKKTERATFRHALRAHLQAVVWKTMNANTLDPLEWGWKEEHNTLVPIMTDQDPAPPTLLSVIRC